MPAHAWTMENSLAGGTSFTMATGTGDTTLTVPRSTLKADLTVTHPDTGNFWFLVISGQPVAVNFNAAAVLATCPIFPIGMVNPPIQIMPGTVIHAIGATAGTLSIVKARIAD